MNSKRLTCSLFPKRSLWVAVVGLLVFLSIVSNLAQRIDCDPSTSRPNVQHTLGPFSNILNRHQHLIREIMPYEMYSPR